MDKYESAFGAPAVQGGTGLVDSFTSARSRAASGTASGALSGVGTIISSVWHCGSLS